MYWLRHPTARRIPMLDSFEETYAQYKKLFAKIDEATSIRGKNELFRQLAALLTKMEQGIYCDNSTTTPSGTNSQSFFADAASWL